MMVESTETTTLKHQLPSLDEYQNTQLHYLAFCGNYQKLKDLLEQGADPNQPNAIGCTALHFASGYSQEQLKKDYPNSTLFRLDLDSVEVSESKSREHLYSLRGS